MPKTKQRCNIVDTCFVMGQPNSGDCMDGDSVAAGPPQRLTTVSAHAALGIIERFTAMGVEPHDSLQRIQEKMDEYHKRMSRPAEG